MSDFGQTPQQPGQAPGFPPPPPAPAGPGAGISQQLRTLLIVGLAGSALAFLGTFLPWITAEAPEDLGGGSDSANGMVGDGVFTLIAAILAVALFAAAFQQKKIVLAAAAGIPALIGAIFAFLNVFDPERLARADLEDQGATSEQIDMALEVFDLSSGIGIYLVTLGFLAALVAAALAGLRARAGQ
ncbi:hypothetical protein RM780_00295 [Streptomyces sp. DSM 44917]|uniref:DUF4199 domain-containing protein n=1 Tax=Streptomyces boetiae TaxID=3075541 RepID=A0ABU2L1G9_9ACTN|nr:hypothetical protein [Streptomyces sp. DSM 44917]MDT0305406.1 hypothetical protein [Streptomyces sp. DSM 44917]